MDGCELVLGMELVDGGSVTLGALDGLPVGKKDGTGVVGRFVGNSEGFRVGVDVGVSVTILNKVHKFPPKHCTPSEGDSPPLTLKSVLALGSFTPVQSPGTHSKRSNELPPLVVHLILPFHPSRLGP